MKTEQLKELGLSEEQISEVFKLHGQGITHAKGQLEERIQQIEEEKVALEGKVGELSVEGKEVISKEEYEAIKQAKEDLKKQLEGKEEEYSSTIQDLKYRSALDMELYKSRAKSNKAVQALLDKDSIVWEEGELKGLTEAIELVKSEHSYLFDDEQAGGPRYTRKAGEQGEGKKVGAFEAAANKILNL